MLFRELIQKLNEGVIVKGSTVTDDGGPDAITKRKAIYTSYTGVIKVKEVFIGIKPVPVVSSDFLSITFDVVVLRVDKTPSDNKWLSISFNHMTPAELESAALIKRDILHLIEYNEDIDALLSNYSFQIV